MKRIIFKLLPIFLQEQFKLIYYNFKNRGYKFGLKNQKYITNNIGGWQVTTNSPLYFIVKDIDRYEKFYKIKPNDVVIDAGANEGVLSLVYSKKVGINGKVFAFEPDSQNMIFLKKNILLNNNSENIESIIKGLWSQDDTIKFYEAGTVGSSIFYEDENSTKVSIQVTSIDSFVQLKAINNLNFVKMDIEGAEIEALKGAVKTIKKLRPNFAIASYHIVDGQPTYILIEEIFNEINYPYKTVMFNDGEIITYAGKFTQD